MVAKPEALGRLGYGRRNWKREFHRLRRCTQGLELYNQSLTVNVISLRALTDEEEENLFES